LVWHLGKSQDCQIASEHADGAQLGDRQSAVAGRVGHPVEHGSGPVGTGETRAQRVVPHRVDEEPQRQHSLGARAAASCLQSAVPQAF